MDAAIDTAKIRFNGLDATTGHYLLEAPSAQALADAIAEELGPIASRAPGGSSKDLAYGYDPTKLAEAGWGVVFAAADPAAEQKREALKDLLALRRDQAGPRYHEYIGPDGLQPGESKDDFLSRHGAGPGEVDPTVVPYYLLFVGDPVSLPFLVQFQSDVAYAVGRLHFDVWEGWDWDPLAAYGRYAAGVVAAEAGDLKRPRRTVCFGPQNPADESTAQSATALVAPLAKELSEEQKGGWEIGLTLPADATKAKLKSLMGGADTPGVLFTASHGLGFPNGHARQLSDQGALVCQDWPGPWEWDGPIAPEHVLAAADVGDDADVRGLVAFHFACFGAGTPVRDAFAHRLGNPPADIAPHPFVARLPQRLLGHPGGSALAVIGHVERAWGYAFLWDGAGPQQKSFESVLRQIMDGRQVGLAMEGFGHRYAELSDMLFELQQSGPEVDRLKLMGYWTARNDAQSFVILGDPAVRLSSGTD